MTIQKIDAAITDYNGELYLLDFFSRQVVQVVVVDVEGEIDDMFVEGHDLLLRELVHPDKERPLDDLGLLVARVFVVVVTLEVDVDGEDDGVTGDELLHLEQRASWMR